MFLLNVRRPNYSTSSDMLRRPVCRRLQSTRKFGQALCNHHIALAATTTSTNKIWSARAAVSHSAAYRNGNTRLRNKFMTNASNIPPQFKEFLRQRDELKQS